MQRKQAPASVPVALSDPDKDANANGDHAGGDDARYGGLKPQTGERSVTPLTMPIGYCVVMTS